MHGKLRLIVHGWAADCERTSTAIALDEAFLPAWLVLPPQLAGIVSDAGEIRVIGRVQDDEAEALRVTLQSHSGIRRIHAAEGFIVVENGSGSLWTIPLYSASSSAKPIPSPFGPHVVVDRIACGMNHCLAMSKQACFALGRGEHGQLGLGPEVLKCDSFQPILLPSEACHSGFRWVAAASFHSLIVSEPYGFVYSCGNGMYGRLGNGQHMDNVFFPHQVEDLTGLGELLPNGRSRGVASVSCGTWHSVAVVDGGDIYGWGWNKFGQLGLCPDSGNSGVHSDEIVECPRRIDCFDPWCGGDVADDILQAYCGNRFTGVLLQSGMLLCV